MITTVSDRKIWALSSTTDYFVSAPSLEGWNYYPGVFSSNIPPTLLSLSTSSPYAALEKLINTVPGKSYRVKYNLVNPAGCAVEGEAYPVPVVPPFLINVPAAPGAGTSLNEFIFTATSAQTLIRIQRGVDGLGSQIFSLDYVTIEETAEYLPDQLMHTDYYAFGQQMPGRTWVASDYRYGMNGQQKEDEVFKGANSAQFWMYDSRIGKRWEIDPVLKVWESPYACFSDNPILNSDKNGDDPITAAAIFAGTQEAAIAVAATGIGAPVAVAIEIVGSIWGLVELMEDVPIKATPTKPTAVKPKVETHNAQKAEAKTQDNKTTQTTKQKVQTNSKTNAKNKSKSESSETGKIYKVKGDKTESGKPYVGRTTKKTPEERGKSGKPDNRDRKDAEVIDTYDPKKPGEGAYKEQKAIDKEGGVNNLDNKRNEATPKRMEKLEKEHGKTEGG